MGQASIQPVSHSPPSATSEKGHELKEIINKNLKCKSQNFIIISEKLK